MKPALPFSYVRAWLDQRPKSFDAAQDVTDRLKDRGVYVNLPHQFPHKTYLYNMVRDKLRMEERHCKAVHELYDEYRKFKDRALLAACGMDSFS